MNTLLYRVFFLFLRTLKRYNKFNINRLFKSDIFLERSKFSKAGFLYGLRPKSFLSTNLVRLHENLAIWLAFLIDSEGFSGMTFSRIF